MSSGRHRAGGCGSFVGTRVPLSDVPRACMTTAVRVALAAFVVLLGLAAPALASPPEPGALPDRPASEATLRLASLADEQPDPADMGPVAHSYDDASVRALGDGPGASSGPVREVFTTRAIGDGDFVGFFHVYRDRTRPAPGAWDRRTRLRDHGLRIRNASSYSPSQGLSRMDEVFSHVAINFSTYRAPAGGINEELGARWCCGARDYGVVLV